MVKQIEAKLRSLDKAPAEPEAKGPLARLNEAQEAADKANCYCLGLIEKAAGIKKRLNEVQLDWVAVGHAVKKAENALLQANAALAAAATATAAMAAPLQQADAAMGVPSGHHAVLTQQACEEFTQKLMNDFLNTVAEELTQEATAGDRDKAESFMQNLRTKLAAKGPQATGASAPPAVPQPARVVPPRPAPAAAPRAVGSDAARVAPRTSVKTATVEALDHATAIIEKAGDARRRAEREARLAAGREDDAMAGDVDAAEAGEEDGRLD